ncbi:MAG: hypothetical protein D3909_17050, partial [Candidatus Electrothrix sp. ATG1]|nr:hypothetical protein [Candidatus Electrothrix sp. ATG1]
MKKLINVFFSLLLRIRYRITVNGLKELRSRTGDDRPILFLPNHQALIDPVIIMILLYNTFTPRPLADEKQAAHP